jgi:hypothetical protein
MSIGAMKDKKLTMSNLHDSQTLGWSWNWNLTGTPKDKGEVNRREVCECEG